MRTLETGRLILRGWRETDLEDMFVFLSNPNVTIPEGASPCKTLGECKRVLDYLIKKKNQLYWSGTIQPTALSKEYSVFVLYHFNKSPQVWIIGDELEKLDDDNFPHKFEINRKNKMVRICLYRYSEFNSSKLIADTIIPWTIEWLYFYELWLATGEWLGGGEHLEIINPEN